MVTVNQFWAYLSGIYERFHSAPGTGKTLLARAVASQLDCNFLKVRISITVRVYCHIAVHSASWWCMCVCCRWCPAPLWTSTLVKVPGWSERCSTMPGTTSRASSLWMRSMPLVSDPENLDCTWVRTCHSVCSESLNTCPCVCVLLPVGGRRFSEGTSADREIQRTLMEVT